MIRARRSPVLSFVALAAVVACGGVEPPPRVAPPPPPSPERLEKKLEASLAALALPDELLLAGRWKRPNQWLAQLEAWSGRALPLDAWLRATLGDPSRAIDLDAPIELLVVLERGREIPALDWAVSVGLAAPEGAGGDAAPRDVESPMGLACAEGRALGPAPARLVCAASDDALGRLLPAATRALPLAPVGEADLAITLRAAPMTALGPERSRVLASQLLERWFGSAHINERFDAQRARIVDAVASDLTELAADLDGASLELSFEPGGHGLDLSALAPAAPGRSLFGQLLAGSGATGLAPAEFWQTHHASDGAGFSWTWQATPLAPLREPLAALLGIVLDYRGVPNRLEQRARELVAYLPLPRGPIVHARGRLPPPARGAAARAPFLEELGWQLYDVRGNFAEYQHYAGVLAQSFNDPILGAQFARLIRSGFGPQWAPTRIVQRRPIGNDLPRGSFALEITLPVPRAAESPVASAAPSAPLRADVAAPASVTASAVASAPVEASPSAQWFVLFVPDEDGARIAAGADERFLVSLLQPARAKASATLAGRAGLGSLNEHRVLAGGFVTLAGLEDLEPLDETPLWRMLGGRLEAAPHRGATPIPYALSQPSQAWLHLTARIGREALEDISFAIGTARAE